MTRMKLGVLGLCAVVVGMMAMSAGAAQGAFSWLLLNKEMKEVAFLLATLEGKKDSEHITLDGEIAGLKVAITCTNFALKGVMLEAEGKLTNGGKVVFTGCKVYKEAPLKEEYACTVNTSGTAAGTVETNEGKGELVLHTFFDEVKNAKGEIEKIELKEVLTKIEPKLTKTQEEKKEVGNFATIILKGESCPLTELNQVHGTLYLKDCLKQATTHVLEHLVEQGPLTALYIGGHSAKQLLETKLLGSGWVFLTGEHLGYLWAAMDV
jgi:hypothetical protein